MRQNEVFTGLIVEKLEVRLVMMLLYFGNLVL